MRGKDGHLQCEIPALWPRPPRVRARAWEGNGEGSVVFYSLFLFLEFKMYFK